MHRRSSDDEQWKKVKEIVYTRDRNRCRLTGVLKLGELKEALKNTRGPNIIDPAHYKPVSIYPEYTYNSKNVVCLSRKFHRSLDNLINPLTGKPMTKNEQEYWWWRIFNHSTKSYDENFDYEQENLKFIK